MTIAMRCICKIHFHGREAIVVLQFAKDDKSYWAVAGVMCGEEHVEQASGRRALVAVATLYPVGFLRRELPLPEAPSPCLARRLSAVVCGHVRGHDHPSGRNSGAPQITVQFDGATILVRGQRPGEQPGDKNALQSFANFVRHDQWGTDHFGFTVVGDLNAFCDAIKAKGGTFSVEPTNLPLGHVSPILPALTV